MAAPDELSLEEIRNFMLKNGGKVTNHELVKHFKQFLTNPNTKGIFTFHQLNKYNILMKEKRSSSVCFGFCCYE